MAQSLFMSLTKTYPDCKIDVLAPQWSLPLLERMAEVSKAIIMPLKHKQFGFIERIRIGKRLRSEHYDQAIVLPNSWKSALIPLFAGIPKRTGFIGECRWGLLNDPRTLDKTKLKMTVQRFVTLGLPKHSPLPPDFQPPSLKIDKACQESVIKKFDLTLSDKIMALCPGAEYGPSKRWPANYFAQVAKNKIEQGWQVLLLGSEKEGELLAEINQETQNQCLNLSGQTTLTEAIDLISLASLVIANDSGLMHLAAALDKKVIAIYGSTSPELAPPLCDKSQTISLDLPCVPCGKRVCPLFPVGHPNHTQCLTGIKPERILELIDR